MWLQEDHRRIKKFPLRFSFNFLQPFITSSWINFDFFENQESFIQFCSKILVPKIAIKWKLHLLFSLLAPFIREISKKKKNSKIFFNRFQIETFNLTQKEWLDKFFVKKLFGFPFWAAISELLLYLLNTSWRKRLKNFPRSNETVPSENEHCQPPDYFSIDRTGFPG